MAPNGWIEKAKEAASTISNELSAGNIEKIFNLLKSGQERINILEERLKLHETQLEELTGKKLAPWPEIKPKKTEKSAPAPAKEEVEKAPQAAETETEEAKTEEIPEPAAATDSEDDDSSYDPQNLTGTEATGDKENPDTSEPPKEQK